jgi:DNA-binding NtrC family response regulator
METSTNSGKLILVVDDETVILRAVTTALAEAGFRVIVAEHGAAGLEAFAKSPEDIDLVLTDVVMPAMNGVEMSTQIRSIRPDVPIILMTAYSDIVIRAMSGLRFVLVRKPFLPEDLVRAVRAQLGLATSA